MPTSLIHPLAPPPFPQPPPAGEDLKQWTADLNAFLVQQFAFLLDLTGGKLRWQNFRSQLCSHSIDVAADTAFQIDHNLGKIPEFYVPNVDTTGAMIYATSTNLANWTEVEIELQCNLSGTGTAIALTLLVM